MIHLTAPLFFYPIVDIWQLYRMVHILVTPLKPFLSVAVESIHLPLCFSTSPAMQLPRKSWRQLHSVCVPSTSSTPVWLQSERKKHSFAKRKYICLAPPLLTPLNPLLFSADLWDEKFIDCRMENTTFEHNKHGCHLDTVEENDVLIYLVSFLGSLAVLPGNIISALFVEKIGRVKIIGDVWDD